MRTHLYDQATVWAGKATLVAVCGRVGPAQVTDDPQRVDCQQCQRAAEADAETDRLGPWGRSRARSIARGRAATRLIAAHRGEFDGLWAEETPKAEEEIAAEEAADRARPARPQPETPPEPARCPGCGLLFLALGAAHDCPG